MIYDYYITDQIKEGKWRKFKAKNFLRIPQYPGNSIWQEMGRDVFRQSQNDFNKLIAVTP